MMLASIVLPRPTSSARIARPPICRSTRWATSIWWGSSLIALASRVISRSKPGTSAIRSASRRRSYQARSVGGAFSCSAKSFRDRSSTAQVSSGGAEGLRVGGGRLTETADPSLGHDHIVEPHVSSARVRDVVLQPDVVQLKRGAAPELDVQRARDSGRVVALRAVGPSRAVVVLHPVPGRTGLGKPLDEHVILPHFERGPCGGSHVGVEVGVDLDARPPVVLYGEGVPAHESVPPVCAATARARVHLHPVVVEIEAQVWRGAPHWL